MHDPNNDEGSAFQAKAIYEAASRSVGHHPLVATSGVSLGDFARSGLWPQRGWQDALIIPLYSTSGRITSIMAIDQDGTSDFLTNSAWRGSFFPLGRIRGSSIVAIGVDVGTAAAVVTATGFPAVAAASIENLLPVAEAIRKLAPDTQIVLCTGSGPGLEAAVAAAHVVRGKVAVPGEGHDGFLSLWRKAGSTAVVAAITQARSIAGPSVAPVAVAAWPDPLPLMTRLAPQPYPVDALPPLMQSAVAEVEAFVKAPLPLVATSALTAVSLAAQAHYDVERAVGLVGPIGVYALVVAESGERKSTCDKKFQSEIVAYQTEQAEAMKPALRQYRAEAEAFEAQKQGLLNAIKTAEGSRKPTDRLKRELVSLQDQEPERPRVPRLLYMDATPEALAMGLAHEWPSGGIVAAEGGVFFGAHGMSSDSVTRTLAQLNAFWDGGRLVIDRRTSDSFVVEGARVSISLQVQESVFRQFLGRTGSLARGSGFLARFLLASPTSTQGTREFVEPDETWPSLERFNRRVREILEQPVSMTDSGSLSPATLKFTEDAKQAWIDFHNSIERGIAPGCELSEVKDVASKAADNAARLAALFQVFEHGFGTHIGLDCTESACRLAAWHLSESRRFLSELTLPPDLANASRLDDFLVDYCIREGTDRVRKNHVRQYGPLRDKALLDRAIVELTSLRRIRLGSSERTQLIFVNPRLLETRRDVS